MERLSKKNKKKISITMIQKDFKRFKYVYAMAILGLAYYFIFHYWPMYGIQIAFRDFRPARGIWGSTWIGLRHFKDFFNGIYIQRLIRNTVLISFYELIFSFPAPIIFALLLNEVRSRFFKRTVQTSTYLPHFISQVIICGILIDFLSTRGLFNDLLEMAGLSRTAFLQDPKNFRAIYVGSGIWQSIGYGSIIFLSALSSVDTQLFDAAVIDGCNRFQRVWHVTIPGILPTIIIMLILRIGSMMSVGFEKVILLYNNTTMETADVISSFVYRYGMQQANYGFATAVGLFNSVINFSLLVIVNAISRKVTETSLW